MQNISKVEDQGVKFIGTVQIKDEFLVFPKKQTVSQHRLLTCVPALIDYETLNKALLESSIKLIDLERHPALTFPSGYRLQ